MTNLLASISKSFNQKSILIMKGHKSLKGTNFAVQFTNLHTGKGYMLRLSYNKIKKLIWGFGFNTTWVVS